jgi:hypothetical protein
MREVHFAQLATFGAGHASLVQLPPQLGIVIAPVVDDLVCAIAVFAKAHDKRRQKAVTCLFITASQMK